MSFPKRIGKLCEHCRVLFRPDRPFRRYCSRLCAAAARPRAARVEAGRKGGKSKTRGVTDWVAIAALSPVEAFKAGRSVKKAWLGNRMQEAYRAGYSAGYEDGYEQSVRSSA